MGISLSFLNQLTPYSIILKKEQDNPSSMEASRKENEKYLRDKMKWRKSKGGEEGEPLRITPMKNAKEEPMEEEAGANNPE